MPYAVATRWCGGMDGYGVFSSQHWPKQPGATRAFRKGSLNQFACCEKPPFAIERCLKYVAFRYQGTLEKQDHLSHPAMVRHSTLLFALSGVLVRWFGLSFDPGAASSFAVENQGRRRPKNDNTIHTPASSTDRLDHGLTKADKIKLSQLKQAGRQAIGGKCRVFLILPRTARFQCLMPTWPLPWDVNNSSRELGCSRNCASSPFPRNLQRTTWQ